MFMSLSLYLHYCQAPQGCAVHVREAPTIAALRRHAQRLGFSDRELVAVLLGARGQKRGLPPPDPSPSASSPEVRANTKLLCEMV
jgi:hypothetical protein